MCGCTLVRTADAIYEKHRTPPRVALENPAAKPSRIIPSKHKPPPDEFVAPTTLIASLHCSAFGAPRPTHHSSLYLRPCPATSAPHFVLAGRSFGFPAALVVPWVRLDDRVLRAVLPPHWLAFYRRKSGGAPCSVLSLFLLLFAPVHPRVSVGLRVGSKWRGGRRSDRERSRTLGVLRTAQAFPFPRAVTRFF